MRRQKSRNFHPVPGGDLNWAKGSLDTIHGLIKTEWRKGRDGSFNLDVTVPANTHATLYLPALDARAVKESGRPAEHAPGVLSMKTILGEPVFELGGGTYHFRSTISH